MNEPTITVTKTSTTRTSIRLTEEQAADVLRKHFDLPNAQVEFECRGGYLFEIDISDTKCTEEILDVA